MKTLILFILLLSNINFVQLSKGHNTAEPNGKLTRLAPIADSTPIAMIMVADPYENTDTIDWKISIIPGYGVNFGSAAIDSLKQFRKN